MAGAGTEWLEKSQCPRISCLFFKWLLGLFDVRARYRQPSRQSGHEAV
jgi:hypothetical protein